MPRGGVAADMIACMRPRCLLRPRPICRTGLTIVEVLTALVLVSVGLLGMAGTSVLSLRAAAAAERERRALRRLDLRIAALTAGGCGSATQGSAGEFRDGVWERWTVGAATRGAALGDATVEWREGTELRAIVRRSALLC